MSTQNYPTPGDDQKYGRKHLGRTYLPPKSQHKKNNKET